MHHRKYSCLIGRLSFIVFFLACQFIFVSNLAYASHYLYTVEFDDSLASAQISVCFDGEQDDYLEIDRFVAYKSLIQQPRVSGIAVDSDADSNIEIEGRFWNVKGLSKDTCIKYAVSFEGNLLKKDLAKSRKAKRGMSSSHHSKKIIHLEENNWLWLPERYDSLDTIDIELILFDNYQISTPWQQLNFNKHLYRLGHEPQDWGYHIVIGDIDVAQIEIGKERRINIATINANSTTKSSASNIVQWLENIANSIKNYLGQYPLKQMQVVV